MQNKRHNAQQKGVEIHQDHFTRRAHNKELIETKLNKLNQITNQSINHHKQTTKTKHQTSFLFLQERSAKRNPSQQLCSASSNNFLF
jgi:hypothetical protein